MWASSKGLVDEPHKKANPGYMNKSRDTRVIMSALVLFILAREENEI